MPTMIRMTASHLDCFAVDQLKSCALDIVVATSVIRAWASAPIGAGDVRESESREHT